MKTTYHFVYLTTNHINSKKYIGVHSTYNLDDGYIGSGLALLRSVRKNGIEAFSRQILSFHPDRESALVKESELVTMDVVNDPTFYNMIVGGRNRIPGLEVRKKISETMSGKPKTPEHIAAVTTALAQRKLDGKQTKAKGIPKTLEHRAAISAGLIGARVGFTHSAETKEKIAQRSRLPRPDRQGKPTWNAGMKGQYKISVPRAPASEETKAKISATKKAQKRNLTTEHKEKIKQAWIAKKLAKMAS